MSAYKNILVAVDLSDESTLILDKAREIADFYHGDLSLVHVMEPIAVGYALEVTSVDIEGLHTEATRHARSAMQALGSRVGIPEHRLYNVVGQPAREIRALAKELKADLVIMGGHGKQGLDLLFGSTSSGVTHGVSCDLLIVRVPD
jgi:universal stress protein A